MLQIPDKSHHMCFLNDYTRDILNRPLRIKDLAMRFEFNSRTALKTLARGPQEPHTLGRHAALKPEAESSLVALLFEPFEAGKAMTFNEFLQAIRGRHDPRLTKGGVHAFLDRHLDELQLCCSLPEEETSLKIPRAYLDDYINVLKNHLVENVAELVFNLDELGSVDWEDRKMKKVITPSLGHKEEVYHAISRCERHLTLLACISGAVSPIRDSFWSRDLERRNSMPSLDFSWQFDILSEPFSILLGHSLSAAKCPKYHSPSLTASRHKAILISTFAVFWREGSKAAASAGLVMQIA
jgi:hypothetical protein